LTCLLVQVEYESWLALDHGESGEYMEYPNFSSLESMIEHLKGKPYVRGLLEYGSRHFTDMSPGGDYDIFVITDNDHQTVASGISFYVNTIPVDCGFRCCEDLDRLQPPTCFDVVLINARRIYDREGDMASIQERLRARWGSKEEHRPGDIQFDRFAFRHVLDKVRHRITLDPQYAAFMLHSNLLWMMEAYISYNSLPTGDFKHAWEYMHRHQPDWYSLLTEFHKECSLMRKYEITEQLCEGLMERFGGLWGADEVFFHLRDPGRLLTDGEKQHVLSMVL